MVTQSTLIAFGTTPVNSYTTTTGSFTPAANSLVAVVATWGNGNGITATSVTCTSTGGTPSNLKTSAFNGSGVTAIWCYDAGSSPASQTVTVTAAPTTVLDVDVIVLQVTGAMPAATQVTTAATSAVTSSGTIATINITPAFTGSLLLANYASYTNTSPGVANAYSTEYTAPAHGANGDYDVAFYGTNPSTAGTQVTLGATTAKAGTTMCAVEIEGIVVTPTNSWQPGGKQWRMRFRRFQRLTSNKYQIISGSHSRIVPQSVKRASLW